MSSFQTSFENINQIEDFNSLSGQISISLFQSSVRNLVPYFVYLPPNWTKEKQYPLVIFMHGQGGDETTFNKYVQAEQLNEWIESGEIEPVVIAGVRGDNDREGVQWFTEENESLFAASDGAEFINFCKETFNAGTISNSVSLEGHSRGAAGSIHYYMKYPGEFASVMAMGYVSDYTLVDNYLLAKKNLNQLQEGRVPFHLEIGTEDSFVLNKGRKCTFELHQFLLDHDIEHGFEVLHGVEHRFDYFWNYYTDEGILNGLSHLKFHEKARKG